MSVTTEPADRRPARSQPVWLALTPDPVLAFLDDQGGECDTAVLLCPPFGWQDMASYRRRRTWAQRLAHAGFPTARFDLPGSGDSGGLPGDPGRFRSWLEAVSRTSSWLRDATGARHVAAIGIGLGGVLVCRAVADGAPIDDLILWAVPRSGRILLREMHAYAGVVASRFDDQAGDASRPDGDLELVGFRVSAETAQALNQLDLTALALPAAPRRRVLLLGHDGLEPDRRLARHFEEPGWEVTADAEDDYSVLMAEPQDSRVPEATIARTIGWLGRADGGRSAEPRAPERRSRPPASRRPADASITLSYRGCELIETALALEGGTFGMLTRRAGAEPAGIGAVWLNGGALRHTGPNRAWVEIARRWAARGVPTVRVDLRGIGDSDGDERQLLPNEGLYATDRNRETLSVLDQLESRGLAQRFVLGGLCSGAYWSLHAALADNRVIGAVLVNLYAFFWSDALVAERQTQGSIRALQGRAWRRLARGDLTSDPVTEALRSLRPSRIRAAAGHPVERSQQPQIELALDRLRDKETCVLMLLSIGEPFYEQLARHGVLNRLERWPNLVVEQLPSRDHLFRALHLQQLFHDTLDRALDRALNLAVSSVTQSGQPQLGEKTTDRQAESDGDRPAHADTVRHLKEADVPSTPSSLPRSQIPGRVLAEERRQT